MGPYLLVSNQLVRWFFGGDRANVVVSLERLKFFQKRSPVVHYDFIHQRKKNHYYE